MAKGFIPLAKQMDFLWSELQGKEKAGFGKFLSAGVNTPEDYATLWDKTYERSGGAGDAKARDYAGSVFAAMSDGTSNQELISPNAKFTYNYLTQKGMTPQQAAGVTGRLMAESYEEMNPDARNTLAGGQGTYGVAQWRGSRMDDLADFAGVDVGDITSLPATAPGGGLLTSNQGSSPMIDPKKAPLMGSEAMYKFDPQASQQAAQQAQRPQQGGLGGLLSTLKDKAMTVDPQTGMTGFERFASALDPLIMERFRSGDAIKERGAGRVAAGNKNRTIEMLRARGRADLADMVERGMISISDAAAQMLSAKPSVVGGDFKDAQSFRKEFTSLPRIKSFAGVTEAYSRIVASAKDPSAAGDLSLIFNFMKVLDPGSTVREGEFATAQNAGGVDARVRSLFNSVVDGTRLDAGQRADFLDRANRLYKSQESLVLPLYDYYGNIATSRGFDPEMVLPQFGYTGDMPGVAPEFAAMPPPPMPAGATADGQPLTQPAWQAIWNARSTEEKKKFMETGAFE
tara:strand:- start:2005 stop:3546 length:1542 start_codon:yes stop_codon:yes gene_type:complete